MSRNIGLARDRAPSYVGTIRCPTCRGDMITKFDAIGRTYERCPACQRVAPPHHHAPDEVLIPQTLVPAVSALPPVRAGQLRCQQCAQGVTWPRARFCARCHAARGADRAQRGTRQARRYAPMPCADCTRPFLPTGPHAKYCEDCR